MNTHVLAGCQPTPLASYLKALGVLRLVAQQCDPETRGRWTRAGFELSTRLTADELTTFFTRDYHPTPIVAPWNGGSGYYAKDSQEGIAPIEASDDPRFEEYRRAIAVGRAAVVTFDLTERPDADLKPAFLAHLRASLDDAALDWLDAVVVLADDGLKFPPLLGTGGNDGRLDFTNNQMQRLVKAILGGDARGTAMRVHAALFGSIAPALDREIIGQFSPSAAGGANAGPGFDGATASNVWDYILALEGAVSFAAALTRRDEDGDRGGLVFPFTVRAAASGYGSAARAESENSRNELWLPLWNAPATPAELARLFGEGRAKVGKRAARTGVDFARAIAGLGVDRGIGSFQRYGFHVRNGLAYFAVPLGEWTVGERRHVDLLSRIDPWLEQLRRACNDKFAPASLVRAGSRVDDAIMAMCRRDDARAVAGLLIALGEVDGVSGRSPAAQELLRQPVPPLDPGWLEAAQHDAVEFRLAASLASTGLRRFIAPVATRGANERRWNEFVTRSPEIVWGPSDLVSNLGRVLRRWSLDPYPPVGVHSVRFSDLEQFIRGEVDDERVDALARGLALIDWPNVAPVRERGSPAAVTPAYALLRAAHTLRTGDYDATPRALADSQPIHTPGLLERALAGDLHGATTLAHARLRGAGGHPRCTPQFMPTRDAVRLGAALAFPLSHVDERALRDRVAPTRIEEKDSDVHVQA